MKKEVINLKKSKENRRGRGIWREERELFNPIIISERKRYSLDMASSTPGSRSRRISEFKTRMAFLSEFQASQGYTMRLCLKTKKGKKEECRLRVQRRLSSWEHCCSPERMLVQCSAPTLNSSQLPVTTTPAAFNTFGFCGHLH